MQSMRAMAVVSTGPAAFGSTSSAVSPDTYNATTSLQVAQLSARRLQKWKAFGSGDIRIRGLNIVTTRRRSGVVRASSAGDEPLDHKVDKAAKEVRKEADETKQAWNRSVKDAKAEAHKVEGASEETANKELEKLKDITNQLLGQAEMARQRLTATAQETAYRQKDNLEYVAENGPDPVKEVAESALNAHYSENQKQGSKIHDFCLGIPYGVFLVAGGLLWFIITGGTAPIRFGVLLGGSLLALSVTSLKMWKRGESCIPYIQGQAAITAIIFFRYFRRYAVNKLFFPTGIVGLVSAGMLAFYVYVLTSGGNPPKKPKANPAQ